MLLLLMMIEVIEFEGTRFHAFELFDEMPKWNKTTNIQLTSKLKEDEMLISCILQLRCFDLITM